MSSEPSCPDPENLLLSEFVEGTLATEATARVEAHLRRCTVCPAEVDGLRAFAHALEACHLSSDEIVVLAWGESPQEEPHLQHCARCREEVEAVRSARPVDAPVKEARSPALATARWWPLPVAAVLVAGLGLAYLQIQKPPTGAERPPVTRGLPSLGRLQPSGSLSRSIDLVFTWDGPTDRGYRVSFLTVDGRLLHATEVPGRRLVLMPSERALLERETEFFWKVEALSIGGAAPTEQVARISWQP